MLKQSALHRSRPQRLRLGSVRCFFRGPGRREGHVQNKAPEAPRLSASQLKFPDPPTTRHSDLASFLAYSRRTGLNEKSTVYVGTHYEYTVAGALSMFGFSLKRIGGASDNGTDLIGAWSLPSLAQPIRVLLQCKAGVQRVGPHHVRELEGAFVGAPVGWRGDGVLGVLVTERAATKGVRDSLSRSRWPMAFFCCSKSGFLSQMLWNRRAEDQGLEGLDVTVKHAHDQDPELVLARNGEILA